MAMGLSVPDSRLDRPEHVARGKCILAISDVVATATSASENTGEYRGYAIGACSVNFRKRMFTEHGTLLGLVCIKPRMQFRHRVPTWAYVTDKDALFQQELARDTQVVVKQGEYDSKVANIATTVGYVRRDDWLRTAPDVIAGRMQNDAEEVWHTGQDYGGTMPSLANALRVDDTEVEHIFQDQTADAVQIYCYFDNRIGKRSMIPRGAV